MARAQMLPDDMLADVLGRLTPRGLAVSRCVCTAWRAVIDARRLLRPDLLPLSLAGVLVNYVPKVAAWRGFAELFSQPCSPAKKLVSSSSSSSSFPYPLFDDHCNGLLLLHDNNGSGGVLNPATGWRMALPECPRPAHAGTEDFWQDMYLVFDPTVSSSHPCFEVFLVPRVPSDYSIQGRQIDRALLESRWPLSPCILNVFSSVTGRWEQRWFHRDDGEGGAGTVADVQRDADRFMRRRRYAVYFRGALYVHCEYDFVMRISLSTNKYHMIKPPPTVFGDKLQLGKSENGIYLALLAGHEAQLWVWILAETNMDGQAEWILRHATADGLFFLEETGAGLLLPSRHCIERFHEPWILQHITGGEDDQNALAEHDEYQWNNDSDNDEEEIILHNENNGQTHRGEYLEILAFHPYKEILFLHISMRRGLAYHLDSKKLEDLGDLSPDMSFRGKIGTCFPYTPCWI